MIIWIKKYYKICPIWMILGFNLLLVILMSPIPLFGAIFTFGLFSEPTTISKLIGIVIFAVIPMGIFISNFILYKIVITMKYGDVKQFNAEEEGTKRLLIKLAITVLVILLGFSAMYIFNDLWLFFNGWWF